MADTNLRIDLAAEFTGAKAFKKAQDSTLNLEKSVKNLGRALGITLGSAAIIRFGKESVKAFVADEKAATVLANTMKNLGLEMSAPRVEQYIQSLEKATGVMDDQLRPAMQTLLQVTGSVTSSQKILAQAIEVSRATGIDLTTVAQDLGQAYVGNTRGLRKYSLGLTQAELKTASFADITNRMTKLFGGANEAYLETYAGQMERLAVAAGEATEAIGKGLVDALANLGGGGSGGIDRIIKSMEDLSFYTAKFIRGFGGQIGALGKLLTGDLKGAAALLNSSSQNEAFKGAIPSISSMVQASEQAKAEKAAIARSKELAKSTAATTKSKKEQLLLEKAKLALTKAAANFDITKINLAAALKGKVSEEDRKRLLALQAIENENGELALKYISQLDYARKLAADAEEERLKKLSDAEKARHDALIAQLQAKMQMLQDLTDKIQRKIAYNAAEALGSISATMTSTPSSNVGGYSQAFINNPYVLGGSPESLGLSDRANTERNAALQLNISLDGQAFQSAVVGAVNQASASGTQLSYTQTAVR